MTKRHPLFTEPKHQLRQCDQCKKFEGRVVSGRRMPNGEHSRRIKCKACGYVWNTCNRLKYGPRKRFQAEDVREILLSDAPAADMARRYSVSLELIYAIKRGQLYAEYCRDISRGHAQNCRSCIHFEGGCSLDIPEAQGRLTWARYCSCFFNPDQPAEAQEPELVGQNTSYA